MIITKISRLGTYVGVNPHFATLIDFLEKTGLENLTEGSIAIDGNRLFGKLLYLSSRWSSRGFL